MLPGIAIGAEGASGSAMSGDAHILIFYEIWVGAQAMNIVLSGLTIMETTSPETSAGQRDWNKPGTRETTQF
jgi:hypothetical protein